MQIHIGDVPDIGNFQPEAEGLHSIRGPRVSVSYLLAGLTGFLLLPVPIFGLGLILSYFGVPASLSPEPLPIPWAAIFMALLLCIPLHELSHLVCHPSFGISKQSILVIWPARLRFGVYYEGCMSRAHWLLMRIAPFVFLSFILISFSVVFQSNRALNTFFWVLAIANGVGSGGDVVAILLVLFQVPSSALLCFRGGRAYWQPIALAGNNASPSE